jgi:uncharacterized membrane protein
MVPSDFTLAHAVAITLLFAAWWLYSPILKLFGRGTLNAQLGVVRLRWMSLSIARQNRTFDALLLNQVISSVAFFGSATLIVVAGLIGTFANVKAVHAVIADLHFFAPMSVELLAINLGAVALILGISFFSFTYALRKADLHRRADGRPARTGPDDTGPHHPVTSHGHRAVRGHTQLQ